ncbi:MULTISPECIES: AI-2E family transporter [Cryobacterium]|uniref:AI-2E family transporter n=1 Tax=Cryobacterium zongtaii TaxID=1259217 RepID=A0A2S3ZKL0_9MICO|nr:MULTISPECIES: AI-2E family transporter [Cryobacterium]ASD21610.1 AI-2E family transporter [Cryobacterium sp. LW097]POH63116.1 AI-2E family transporter [Cryobacterium zongtaii]POH68835.1 AI-2E family transporter [Cryobacterium zongtaii]TFC43762.1 AI-2E family transporter [Cryobacterium sp. TMN-39-2]TFC54971.1 AI-2E family transporter [Cryobacterium sp. TMB3-1-2]
MRIPDNTGARRAEPRTDGPTTLRTLLTDKLGWLGLRSGQILLALALVAVVIFILVQVKLVVIPLLIAIILASALSPVIGWLRRRGLSPILATWVTLLTAIVVFGGIVTLIVVAVENQWSELVTSASDGIDQLFTYLTEGPLALDSAQLEDFRDQGIDFLTSSQFGSGALAGVSVATEIITGAVLVVVILFFFLKDGDVIWKFFLRPFRGERLQRGRRIGTTSVRVLGGYVRGTAIIAFVDAAAIGIGLAVLGVPLALPLAVIVFLTAFIPLIGATVAGILAALVALVATDWVIALIVVGIVIVVNQLEGNFLQPVVMAQSLKLHPLVILVALTAGTIVAGIIGAVLAVPIAAVGWAIVKTWNEPPALTGQAKLA